MTLPIAIFTFSAWGLVLHNVPPLTEYGGDEKIVWVEESSEEMASDTETGDENSEERIAFKNIENNKLRNTLLRVIESFEILDEFEITLERKKIKSSTMQAQPELSFKALFGSAKRYRIKLGLHVRGSADLLVEDLPEDVLTGWFAHELGHIADYGSSSNFGMLWFGIKYVISPKFKRKAEYTADLIAIEHGFHCEIIAVKRFILENEDLGDAYKDKIGKYYMSIEEVYGVAEDVQSDEANIEP